MASRPLIVLSLDALVPSALGCYGSSWSQTPTIDALASQGWIWDRCISHHTDPMWNLRRWLEIDSGPDSTTDSWIEAWQSHGPIEFLSDSHEAINLATKSRLDQLYLVDELEDEATDPAASVEATQFAQLIASGVERLQDPEPLGVLWLHSGFLNSRWDAPRWLVDTEFDEEIEEPSDEVELLGEAPETDDVPLLPLIFDHVQPPSLQLDEAADPDLITAWMTTYACQIRLVDELLNVLLTAARELQPTVMLCGTSGFSHGQNGWIGHGVGPLRSCHLRLPLIVSQPHASAGSLRCRTLMGSSEVPSLLARMQSDQSLISPQQWSEADEEFTPIIKSESADGDHAVTSAKWFYVRQNDDQEHLFLKPDDAEDSNDVGRLRRDVIDQFTE